MSNNILVFNGKGGASKSTNSNIIASNINDSLLVEVDKINETQSDISGTFEVKQINFNHENQQSFLDLKTYYLKIKI